MEREAAVDLPTASRLTTPARFFRAHPGDRDGPFGLGRAIVDFVAWELRSGRLADTGGSRWWRAVNGCMTLDLRAATATLERADTDADTDADADADRAAGGVAMWRAYAAATRADAQDALWRAHQASLVHGLAVAAPLLAAEHPAEREFAGIAIQFVVDAAAVSVPTGRDALARLTKRFYPAHYPATDADVSALRGLLLRTRAHSGKAQSGNAHSGKAQSGNR
jgi:hypothetical protein